jgi:hypothetical protein
MGKMRPMARLPLRRLKEIVYHTVYVFKEVLDAVSSLIMN